jgi:hypothetical protein
MYKEYIGVVVHISNSWTSWQIFIELGVIIMLLQDSPPYTF